MTSTLRVKNQKPGKLNPVYNPSAAGAYDARKYISDVFIPLLRTPLVPTAGVDILHNGQSMSDDDIIDLMLTCCQGFVVSDAEELTRSLFHQTLVSYNPNTNLLLREMFAVAAGTEANLPEPDSQTIYTPATDVIPAASKFLQGTTSYEEFFASFAYYFRLEAFGVFFVNEQAFDDFKAWFQAEINTIQNLLNSDCLALVSEFMKFKLNGLTESFKLRDTENDNLDEFCFARVLISLLMRYFGTTALAGIMPFDFEELFCPKNVVFVNVERYAHSTPAAIARDLKEIKQAIDLSNKIKMISNKQLTRLGATARSLNRTQQMAANAASNKLAVAAKAALTPLRSKAMTPVEYLNAISKILKKMTTEMRTTNVYKRYKQSYQKSNRRNPDDYNLQGKIVSTKYYPDLHIYLDTSGSVTEPQYEAGMKLCIQLARKLNVNLYINSFSHVMSQTHLLQCQGKTLKEIYAKFQKIAKVTGGTDYAPIWRFINASPKRKRELSIIITDFEYHAPSNFIAHPDNLYYMPFANIPWDIIKLNINGFMKSALHNDSLIRTKILA